MMEKVSIHILQGDVRISASSEVDLHYRLLTTDKWKLKKGQSHEKFILLCQFKARGSGVDVSIYVLLYAILA